MGWLTQCSAPFEVDGAASPGLKSRIDQAPAWMRRELGKHLKSWMVELGEILNQQLNKNVQVTVVQVTARIKSQRILSVTAYS
jgi:hypothetical protein